MSWIVESLLNEKDLIKERSDISSDEFNDLIIIEKAIKTLRKENILTEEDVVMLGVRTSNDILSNTSKDVKKTLYRKYAQLCERIAYYLGGYFTDEGYLNYIEKKYKLSEQTMNTLRMYIKSEYKHKLMRKPLNGKKS
jgi:hypothetical protein